MAELSIVWFLQGVIPFGFLTKFIICENKSEELLKRIYTEEPFSKHPPATSGTKPGTDRPPENSLKRGVLKLAVITPGCHRVCNIDRQCKRN
jgi:hypothetical protein